MLCMHRGVLAEDLYFKKLVSFSSSAASTELKSAMSSPEAGIADCMVRRVGDAGSNG